MWQAKDAAQLTPLLVACTNCQTNIAEALIEANADLRSTSETGQTCLHKAASVGKFDLVKMITDAALAISPDVLAEVSRLFKNTHYSELTTRDS